MISFGRVAMRPLNCEEQEGEPNGSPSSISPAPKGCREVFMRVSSSHRRHLIKPVGHGIWIENG
jgi:hypothetical protein